MKLRNLLLAGLFAVTGIVGCEGVAYVETEPPPLRVEVRSTPPSSEAIWIDGYWGWRAHEFVWIAGHWERHPHGSWVASRWERRDRGYHFVKGHWDRGQRDRNNHGH